MLIEHPPPLPRSVVHRPRLLDRLEAGVRGPLTIVSGPAGAGKTTLVADWAHAHAADPDRSLVWGSVRDADEADPLLRELARRRPRGGAQRLVVVLDGLRPVSARAAAAADHAHTSDDAHQSDRAHEPALAARLTALLRERDGRVRVVLCTRGEPPLPLARARLDASVVEIGPGELAFTWEEARALLAARLPAGAAHARWRSVEGWAAGLACEPGELPGYLRRELLDALDDEQRDFLLRVSVADELTPALATALTDAPDAAGTLERLARAHALVVPLDRNRGGYRLAPPLRAALRAALPAAPPGTEAELHRRAADWHANAGDPLAAARHALAGEAPELAADVLAASWLDLLAQGRDVEMAELLAAMPAATLAADPELRIVAGALASARDAIAEELDRRWEEGQSGALGHTTDAGGRGVDALDHDAGARAPEAEEGVRPRDSMATTLAAARLRIARLEGDVATATDAAAELSRTQPPQAESARAESARAQPARAESTRAGPTRATGEHDAPRLRRTLALQQLGVAELVAGRADSAAGHLEQALGSARAAGFDHLAVACLGPLASLDAHRGRLRSAQAWGEQAVALAAEIGDARPSALVPAHAGLAVVAWLRDDRCAADAALRRAQECFEGASSPAASLPTPSGPFPATPPPTSGGPLSATPPPSPAGPLHASSATPHDGPLAALAPNPLTSLAIRIPAAWLAPAGTPGDPAAELARLEAAAATAQAQLSRVPGWLVLALDEARVRLLLALGRTSAAAAAASAPRGANRRPERLLMGARVALAREDPAEARTLAARFLAEATPDVRPVHVLEAMLLQAATTYELGTVWDALAWLERAVAAAAEERCRRPFTEGGQPIRALLRVLARRGPWPPVGFVAELLDERPVGAPARADGAPTLSGREQAVLRYLPSSLSKREIASELGVSANTVKTHVSAIYRKFGVGSRPEAVARARELGLLGGSVWER